MDSTPKIQILMATYNGAAFLSEQIDSILAQTYENWELLISDDGSTDGSAEIAHSFEQRDSRIHVVMEDRHFGGAKGNFMALLRLADAPYVMCCDQDDVWDADKVSYTLASMVELEKRDPGLALLVCTDLRVVDEGLNLMSPSFLAYSGMDASRLDMGYFMSSAVVTGCTMMLNRPALELCQEPIDDDKIIMHDWWASLVVAALGRVVHLDRATISYRQHESNTLGAEKFTVSAALAAMDERCATARETFAQVEEMRRVFGERLSAEQRAQADTYVSIRQALPPARLWRLTRCHAWRRGALRKAGEALTFLML